MAITRGEYARAKAAVNKAVSSWAVTKNSNGSYTINTWKNKGTTVWWGWSSYSGSSSTWSTWSTWNNWANKYANNAAYQSMVKQYWADNVHSALDYISNNWGSKSQVSYLLTWGKSINEKPNIGSISSNAASWTVKNMTEKQSWDYTSASLSNYNNAINYMKSQGMSDADAKAAASGLLEKQDLLKNKTEEEKAAEMWPINNQEEEERDAMDTINDVMWEDDYYDDTYSQERDDLIWDRDYWKDYATQLESQTTKTSIPEERDTSYDYNTYFKENLAPDTNYENGESKNTLNDKPQTTLVSQYQEPVTTALNDLGLLTPNEEASASMPNTEEQPSEPKTYNNWEEIISDFNNTLEQMWQEGWTGLAPQAVAQTYLEYKRKLDDYVNNNKLSSEEAEALLSQLKSNKTLNNILRK